MEHVLPSAFLQLSEAQGSRARSPLRLAVVQLLGPGLEPRAEGAPGPGPLRVDLRWVIGMVGDSLVALSDVE